MTDEKGAAKASIEEISEKPMKFEGERVTISGEVESIKSDQAFVIENDDLLWDEQVLVVTSKPVRFGGEMLADDEELTLTGTVRRFVIADIEREIGLDLEKEIEVEFEGKPVIMADRISKVEETARWTAEDDESQVVSLFVIDASPSPRSLAGQSMEIEGTPVMSAGKNGLWVGYGDSARMFVKTKDAPEGLAPGDLVDLKGTLEQTPARAEIEKKWKLRGLPVAEVATTALYLDATEVKATTKAGGRFASTPMVVYLRVPKDHVGRWIRGEGAKVDEVISDRGFWLSTPDSDERVLAIVREDVPRAEMINIEKGQRLDFTALALASESMNLVAGELEEKTKKAIRGVDGFLTMYWEDVDIRSQQTSQR